MSEDVKYNLLHTLNVNIIDYIQQINVFVVSIPEEKRSLIESTLLSSPLIDFVEIDYPIMISQVPSDPYYPLQWYLEKINCPSAWDITSGNSNVVVAVIDSGVDPTHPDLADKLLKGWNFYDNNDDTSDVYGHGTRVAGVVAAIANNNIGIAGVAWKCLILPIRVTNANGYTTSSLISKGLIYAADRGAKVAVISFQVFGGSTITSAAKYFVEKGGVVIAAAGNTGKYENYSDNQYIISVSATSSNDVIASFSSYGPYVDLSAPGVSVYTTARGGGYVAVSGTSFSAPIVAGIAALMYSLNPSLTPNQIEQILESTAVDLGDPGYDVYYGWGRVDAYKALKAVLETTSRGSSSSITNTSTTSNDTTPPTVKIVYPANGETVSGSITVKVDVNDDVGVARVELYKNGVLFAVDFDAPYDFYWDTTVDLDGAYVFMAKAYDLAGNVGESNNVTVNVLNNNVNSFSTVNNIVDTTPPTVKIVKPLNKQVVTKTVSIEISATDDSGVDKIELYIDNTLIATIKAVPYIYNWDSRSVNNGWHKVTAKAYDLYGNYAESSISVYVYNG
ncbi:MAG: S8 family serine peptidase [Candidatus Nezhaarchaeales archaeon]